ncbi:Holliday junction branch migration protein RuvA [Roseococcus microcysteis]|uniref:Holliday junction branch migration protein RuvA n=1 Tax=Roseococcus microcysteis TaxID=2771361 RepID=UPI00168B4181|nr:Holliday junction branch migration protein RuvA [Roseococcus microcysteis]
MIASLTGSVQSAGEGHCVLDVQGVGYLVACSRKTLDRLTAREGTQRLLVEARFAAETGLTLYGFLDAAEREAFRALNEVKNVAAKTALAVLSTLSPEQLARVIAAKDRKALSAAKGVGPTTANRIIDEPAMQKWAVGRATPEEGGEAALAAPLPAQGVEADAVSALSNLGLKRPEAERAVARAKALLGEGVELNALITLALRESAR